MSTNLHTRLQARKNNIRKRLKVCIDTRNRQDQIRKQRNERKRKAIRWA